jgi:hypothetical protein
MRPVSSLYEARTWKAYLLNGSRSAMAPVNGAMNGTLSLVASGSAAMLVGVPM